MRMAFVFFLFAGGWRLAICHFCQHRVLIVTNKLRSKICCAWLNLSFPCHREHSVTVYTTQHTLQLHSPILMDGRLCDLDFGPSTVDAVCILLLLLLFLLVFFLARLCAFMANRFHSPLCTYVCGLLKRSEFVAFVVLKMIWCRLTVAAALFQHYIFTLVRSLHSNSVIYTIFFFLGSADSFISAALGLLCLAVVFRFAHLPSLLFQTYRYALYFHCYDNFYFI